MGSGSEVALCVSAAARLQTGGIAAAVVSMPSWELFATQDAGYRESVIPPDRPSLAVEAGVTQGWERWVDRALGVERFGASAPGHVVLAEFGMNPTGSWRSPRNCWETWRRQGPLKGASGYEQADRTPRGGPAEPVVGQPEAQLDHRRRAGPLGGAGCRGITSNPTIFQKAMTSGDSYDRDLAELTAGGAGPEESYWHLVTSDISAALAVLRRPTTPAPAATATSRWRWRPNWPTMRPPPPRRPGNCMGGSPLPTSSESAGDRCRCRCRAHPHRRGHSINVTLIFSLPRYEEVIEAYLSGLESRSGDLSDVSGVASFFVSRGHRGGSAPGICRRPRGARSARPDRGGAGQAGLRDLPAPLLRTPLGGTRRARRPPAASPVGLHLHEEPRLPGHAVRGQPDRPRHGEHPARGDPRGVRGPRHGDPYDRRRPRRGRRGCRRPGGGGGGIWRRWRRSWRPKAWRHSPSPSTSSSRPWRGGPPNSPPEPSEDSERDRVVPLGRPQRGDRPSDGPPRLEKPPLSGQVTGIATGRGGAQLLEPRSSMSAAIPARRSARSSRGSGMSLTSEVCPARGRTRPRGCGETARG